MLNQNKQIDFLNESKNSVKFNFIKIYSMWFSKLKKELEKYDLTHPQFVVIASIYYLKQKNENEQEINQKKISYFSGIDAMTISQILKLLMKKDLIEINKSENDLRSNNISLTPEGIKKLEKVLPLVEKIDKIFFYLNEEDNITFLELLNKINKNNQVED
ncbi:MarR family winged helix-turn-helix transcriptional regulator [Mesoplasma melaleucae]|uniref:MarR family transcriptional regulator n=1 Tax=Mesoplasma melaleucae TaxID=81459 RepID=A0A2K8NWD4_9MOLU|nr:MarR family transcriptional regulator [Mesoplasma melaleucae]ATZ18129.1 MarR family transcriptional regulator [Mesoplasma melaleucae]